MWSDHQLFVRTNAISVSTFDSPSYLSVINHPSEPGTILSILHFCDSRRLIAKWSHCFHHSFVRTNAISVSTFDSPSSHQCESGNSSSDVTGGCSLLLCSSSDIFIV